MAPPDRLSELPDCLLQTILSSLGARQLVQTTALSRRWRHVWRGVPRLDIDQREFQAADAPADRHGRRDKSLELDEWARFDDFADNLLLSHHHGGDGDEDDNLPLDALRLHVVDKRDASRRRLPLYARWLDWLHACLDRYRPAALEIHSDFDMTVDLRLMGLRSDLSRLNTLRLQGVLHAGGFGDDSVSVCPRLEHVEFTSCAIGFEGVVTARTLKTLVIDRCWRRDDTKEEGAPRPRVQAPALASLRLVMSFQSDIWVFQTPSLVEASIRTTRSFVNRDDEYELLCNLYNVTRLELSGFLALDKIRPKNEARQDLPKFHNLTTLLLDDCDLTGEVYNLLDLFLYNAPNLEKLTLQNCKLPQEWSKSKKMCLSLKFTEINCHKKDDVCQVNH
ncbi:MEIOTIC F-BOX protein MOF-like [Lolium perenne]|uniref:MEIOTIC F-BOX protein MOF-like n=1 Tax=Lolium perenne TaxID=4522 RepID=UPI0021EA0887|nr:MEIOTIC F-BOX protein MOF-like [Lolium perenne]